MPNHGVFLIHRTEPGRRDDVRAVWMEHMAPAVAANPDHLAYFYCFDRDDTDVICVFQLYRSPETAAAFLRTESYRRYLAAVEPLLVGPPQFHAADPEWTKGIGPAGP